MLLYKKLLLMTFGTALVRCMYITSHVHCCGDKTVIIGVQLVAVFAGVFVELIGSYNSD